MTSTSDGFTRPTSTSSTDAQHWFDRGLVWSYAFHHEEAIRCFERAIAADERFALAHWGLAYAAGPNYNKQWDAFDAVDLSTFAAARPRGRVRARELAPAATAGRAGADRGGRVLAIPRPSRPQDLSRWTLAYAEAMGEVHAAHPDDLDVAALYADALLNITAWALWDLTGGQPADGARTLAAKTVLDAALSAPEWHVAPRPVALLHPPDGDVAGARGRPARPPMRCARSCPTPATSCTCPPISTC